MVDDLLLDGINHVALLTKDTKRFVTFYQEVFGATVLDQSELPFGTVTFVEIGGNRDLNVFEIADNSEADRQVPGFERGRIDHIGFQACSMEAFEEARRRLMARGATDGFVTDFGPVYSVFFRDPDGLECEVVVPSPDPGPITGPGNPAPGYEVGVP